MDATSEIHAWIGREMPEDHGPEGSTGFDNLAPCDARSGQWHLVSALIHGRRASLFTLRASVQSGVLALSVSSSDL